MENEDASIAGAFLGNWIGGAFEELGWEVISLDNDPRTEPTICVGVCSWLPKFAPGYFDMIWASPPLQLIRELRPKYWCIENPQTGLLKHRPFMCNLPWSDVTYCNYGYPYKKATRLWHNLPWAPEHKPCSALDRCSQARENGGRHPTLAQRGSAPTRKGNRNTQRQLFSIPPALCREIASAVNLATGP